MIYTQAMRDAGELPSVGVECLVIGNDDDNYYNCEILMHRNIGGTLKVAVFAIKNFDGLPYYYSHCTHGHFKPLTPPIELIQGKAYQFNYKQGVKVINNISGICISSADIFLTVNGSFCIPNCTNIQLLEVKS